jgi:hypothetical protein
VICNLAFYKVDPRALGNIGSFFTIRVQLSGQTCTGYWQILRPEDGQISRPAFVVRKNLCYSENLGLCKITVHIFFTFLFHLIPFIKFCFLFLLLFLFIYLFENIFPVEQFR